MAPKSEPPVTSTPSMLPLELYQVTGAWTLLILFVPLRFETANEPEASVISRPLAT